MTAAATSTQHKAGPKRADPAAIVTALRRVLQPEQVVELRALDARLKNDRRQGVVSGYFNDPEQLARAVSEITESKGIYITLHGLDPALLARACNRIRIVGKNPTTADHDVHALYWLPVDCDAVRPAGVSATHEEHAAAHRVARAIRDYLSGGGWPDPLYGDSGNGAHLLYRVDLPVADSVLLPNCLQALAVKFNSARVKVDLTTFNPSRIWKLYGTIAAKGDNTTDRPHRISSVVECPQPLVKVPRDLLEALAEDAPVPSAQAPRTMTYGANNGQPFDLANWINEHGLDVAGPDPWKGNGQMWIFNVCPFNDSHTDRSAFVGRQPNGAIVAGCHHNGCKAIGWGWSELREHFEPGCRRRNGHQGNGRLLHERPQQREVVRENSHVVQYGWLTWDELMAGDFHVNYLVDSIVVEAQGGIVSGRMKTLKTSVAADLVVSMASGSPFLGRFSIKTPLSCGIMSGESGAATLKETSARVARSKNLTHEMREHLRDNFHLAPTCPKLTDPEHLDEIARFIDLWQLRCLAVDPSYIAFADVGEKASNVFVMGRVLGHLTRLIERTGCSIILLNHNTKWRGKETDKYAPPELAEIAMSGFAEWARFWILLGGRCEWDEGTGSHSLWMRTGGSAGHADLWALDVVEGRRSDEGGRRWQVDITTPRDAQQQQQRAKDQWKAERLERAEQEHVRRLERALAQFPQGETARVLRDTAGLNAGNFGTAIRALLATGKAAACEVTKRGGPYEGYKPVN